MKRGFISGIILSLVVAFITLGYVGVSNAQENRPTHTIKPWPASFTPTPSPSPTPTPPSYPPAVEPFKYAALGDSVASGLGLPYVDSATAQDKRCGRSSQAYPYLVGQQLNLKVGLFACSGASSGDLYTRQWISNYNPRIQVDQAFSQGRPELISITIGANDVQWSQQIRRCYYGTCGTTTQNRLAKLRLALLQQRLHYVMQQIQDRSNGRPPTVVVTGYYNPISQTCAQLYPDRITSQEVDWVSNGVKKLNDGLHQVAKQYSFTSFATVDFSGHDICSSSPWVQSLTDPAPLHPTAEGQKAIAQAVVAAY